MMRELLLGPTRSKKIDEWEAAFVELDVKYNHWFSKRPDVVYPDDKTKIDRLDNHVITSWSPDRIAYKFNESSDLPAMIRADVDLKFKEIFLEW
jgi:hypothetical protein